MPGKRIPDLTALSGANSANNDDVVIFDTTANSTKRISRSQLAEGLTGDLPLQYYLGVLNSAPSQRLNGDGLALGDYYLDAVTKYTSVYNGSGWNSYASVIAAQAASELAEANAEAARDAAFVNADVYASTAAGLAATTSGQQFQVVVGTEIIRYSNNAGTAVEVARYPSASSTAYGNNPIIVYITGSPIPLGGYIVERYALPAQNFTRFWAEITGTATIVVRVDGIIQHAAINVTGTVAQVVSVSVRAGDTVDFWVEAGTPTSIWAQLDRETV